MRHRFSMDNYNFLFISITSSLMDVLQYNMSEVFYVKFIHSVCVIGINHGNETELGECVKSCVSYSLCSSPHLLFLSHSLGRHIIYLSLQCHTGWCWLMYPYFIRRAHQTCALWLHLLSSTSFLFVAGLSREILCTWILSEWWWYSCIMSSCDVTESHVYHSMYPGIPRIRALAQCKGWRWCTENVQHALKQYTIN